jgi:hypothetical protein
MTPNQWARVPDHVLVSGPRFLDYCWERGIRPPYLIELEEERVLRGMRRGTQFRRNPREIT